MSGISNKDLGCPQLLDLIPKDLECFVQRGEQRGHGCSEEKKLELRLGPPGEKVEEEDWSSKDKHNSGVSSLGYFSKMTFLTQNTTNPITTYTSGSKRGFSETAENGWMMDKNGSQTQKFSFSENPQKQQNQAPFLQLQANPQRMAVKANESSSHHCATEGGEDLQNGDKKAFSPASANPDAPNSSQKRSASGSVVGWPPIRSFRKNLSSSSSSKPIPRSQNVVPNKEALSKKPGESCKKGMFVKINMDGVPIERNVDLKTYDSYEKLSPAVDGLFRDLLTAQRESSGDGMQTKQEGEKVITGLLDGSGEYTLVYEDDEGDRMLVGDVPWQ
ncbi:hypothetical protein U1Q18_042645 [Sarracenia purpurea var. burkii]